MGSWESGLYNGTVTHEDLKASGLTAAEYLAFAEGEYEKEMETLPHLYTVNPGYAVQQEEQWRARLASLRVSANELIRKGF